MVLAELGSSIARALSKMSAESTVDEAVLKELLNDIGRALMKSDVNLGLIKEMQANISKKIGDSELAAGVDMKRVIQRAVEHELISLLSCDRKPYVPQRKKCNVIMFVGLQGSGKTTTCTKLAHYYKTRGWSVGLVCADTFRAGAFEQLRQNATKAKVHYYGNPTERDPVVVAREGVKRFKEKRFGIVIVDTSGRHKQSEELFEEMEAIALVVTPDSTVFVLDSTIGQEAKAQAKAFCTRVDVGSVIVTKLDGHAKGGGALSAVAAANAPITFIGVGEHMNELQKFNTRRFVGRILGKGDIATLVDVMKEQKLDDQKELMEGLKKGKFSLRMMRDQFQNILKMGSFGQLMSMIPGLSSLPKESEEASSHRLQSFLVLMDSMTDEELDGDIGVIERSPSRQMRICRGAGVHPSFVRELLTVFKPFATAVSKMKGLPFGKNGEMPKNPAALSEMSKMIPPHMLKQIGGQSGFMSLLSKFQAAESGKGDNPMSQMAGMQQMMQGMAKMGRIQRRTARRK